jgi:hypothetical protein
MDHLTFDTIAVICFFGFLAFVFGLAGLCALCKKCWSRLKSSSFDLEQGQTQKHQLDGLHQCLNEATLKSEATFTRSAAQVISRSAKVISRSADVTTWSADVTSWSADVTSRSYEYVHSPEGSPRRFQEKIDISPIFYPNIEANYDCEVMTSRPVKVTTRSSEDGLSIYQLEAQRKAIMANWTQ